MKRVLSIQDISCVGKCSLTVALPILSAAGMEAAILPTSILSTHTAFKGFTFRDLTDDVLPIVEHWKSQKISFDGIYTGYLGSVRQIEAVEKVFDDFAQPGQLRFVDPAMGDNGSLYVGFSPEFAKRMGYKTIFWSFAYADWDNHRQPSAKAAKAKIMDNLHNGAILLLHPTSETNAMILQAVIQECRSQGYRFGTLDELTAAN